MRSRWRKKPIACWLLKPSRSHAIPITIGGEPAHDPWTTYKLGEAEIDIQDAGSVNLYIGREGIAISENAQLLDLAMLLADERVLEALDASTEALEQEDTIADKVDRLLAATPVIPSRDEAHRKERWDAIIEEIAALDADEQKEITLIMLELGRRFTENRTTENAPLKRAA